MRFAAKNARLDANPLSLQVVKQEITLYSATCCW